MFHQIRGWISLRKALMVAPIALLALGLVVFPSGGKAQEEDGLDSPATQSGFAIEDCQQLSTDVFPQVEDVLAEVVDSGIVSQEQADGFYGFVHGIADTGCTAATILQPQDAISTIADLTNTSEQELMTELRESGSLAEFANEHGVSEAELVDALMARAEANADALVESGEIDQESADKALALIEKLVSNGVHASFDGGWEMPGNGWQMPGR